MPSSKIKIAYVKDTAGRNICIYLFK